MVESTTVEFVQSFERSRERVAVAVNIRKDVCRFRVGVLTILELWGPIIHV